jgi:hypothetical protein
MVNCRFQFLEFVESDETCRLKKFDQIVCKTLVGFVELVDCLQNLINAWWSAYVVYQTNDLVNIVTELEIVRKEFSKIFLFVDSLVKKPFPKTSKFQCSIGTIFR